jgi:hypothetical protein
MILLLGAAETKNIGLVTYFNEENINDLVIVADHKDPISLSNLSGKRFSKRIRFTELERFIDNNQKHIQFIIVTSELDNQAELIWDKCVEWGIPLIVVDSKATKFDTLVKEKSKQPFYWALLKEDLREDIYKTINFLTRNRKQSGTFKIDANSQELLQIS